MFNNVVFFRYSEVFPPTPFKRKNRNEEVLEGKKFPVRASVNKKKLPRDYFAPVDVIIQMGASSKWPQTLEGIRRIKAAFNTKLMDCLKNQFNVTAQAFQVNNIFGYNGPEFKKK